MNCWRCGSHSIYQYLTVVLRGKNASVKQLLAIYSSKITYLPKQKKPRRRRPRKPPHMEQLCKTHRRYLKQRGFNPAKLSREWDLMGTKGVSDRWSWRVIAPIYNADWTRVAYTGRALHPDTRPKWKMSNNEEMSEDPKRLLYGIEKVRDRVLIVEGVSDVWRMGPGAVAVFGIDWKVEQAFQLKSFQHRFIMFDPEEKAQDQARQLAHWLAPFPGETEIISELQTDPGGMKQGEADKIMRELGF